MKNLYVSFLAIAMVLTTFTVPTMAATPVEEPIIQFGDAQNATFEVLMENFPDTINRGQTLSGSVTVIANGNPIQRFRVNFELFVVTPLGDALIESGSFRIDGNSKRTFNVSIPVRADARPGDYTLRLVLTVGNETLTAEHVVTVV
jgi:hypothetical protein